MTQISTEAALPVGSLVQAAEADQPAIAINDHIFMAKDISNAYLVVTDDGGVLINTGTLAGGPAHRAAFAAVAGLPIRTVVLTQSHQDHFGGLSAFADQDAQIIVQRRFSEGKRYRDELRPYYDPRGARIWRAVLGDTSPAWPDFAFTPDILVDDHYAFELGGRRFEIISTPGGETTDALCVWLPDERILFSGNLFGPAFRTVPNLNPIRADKPRSALRYVRSVERARALGAETLITGHGEPILGAEQIAADLGRLADGVRSIHDQTVAGMNAGKTLHTLMGEVRLPAGLELQEIYGTVPWSVRTIWEEYTGWFHQRSTTDMYAVPQSAIHSDLIELAGAGAVLDRARAHLDAGQPLEALHLIDLFGERTADKIALSIRYDALKLLLERAGERRNLNETMWLRSEIGATEQAIAAA